MPRRKGPRVAVDEPWMPMEVEIVKAAGQKRLDLTFLIKNMGDKGLNGRWV